MITIRQLNKILGCKKLFKIEINERNGNADGL